MSHISRRMTLASLTLFVCCLSVFAQGQSNSPNEATRGKLEAARDIEKGSFIIKAWGLMSPSVGDLTSEEDVYQSMLLEQYKIRYEWVAGCLIDEDTLAYVKAYNAVSRAGIEAKYGKGLFERVRKEAAAEYELKYAEKAREYNRKFIEALKLLPKKEN